ncbi:MAG TPA: FAD-binding oxidoreductase [Acidimicrobiia bacterium]|nr:FAD-binding oxidoreductase [Acidimicrobiia bacterium]
MIKSYEFTSLARELTGDIVLAGDAGYDKQREVFNAALDRYPLAIVEVADAADVATVLRYTADNELDFSVRSGGHSTPGFGVVDDAVVIDLRRLKTVDIDIGSETVWAGSGLTAAELSSALGEHGLAVGFGDTGSVGIGGITLGGGVGYLSRKFGLTIDSLLAAEMVTAEGEVIVVDEHRYPDLFWGIRGGGGNFGVVTRFKYALQAVDRILGGLLVLPATPQTVAGFLEESKKAPDELTTIVNVMSCPPMPFLPDEMIGHTVIMGLMAWCGDLDEGKAVIDRFRALAQPLADLVTEIAYPEIYGPEDEDYRPLAVSLTGFADDIPSTTIVEILDAISALDSPMRVTQIRPMGGAISSVAAPATAFAHRDRGWMINVAAFYVSDQDRPEKETWVRDLFGVVTDGDSAGYVGFLAAEGAARVRAAYPHGVWDRLREVKAKYDPENRFHHNQNVTPAE